MLKIFRIPDYDNYIKSICQLRSICIFALNFKPEN